MQHGQHWNGQDVRGWLATEKLDGCRGYWDGQRMWSRSGRAFPVPGAWAAALPAMHLGGEIWAGRGKFPASASAVVRNMWAPLMCFIVFDAPRAPGCWLDRIASAAARLQGCAFASVVPWVTVEWPRHLAKLFRAIGRGGGEGMMLCCCPNTEGYRAGDSAPC